MLDRFQDQVRQNLQMFDRAMKMFSPFAYVRSEDDSGQGEPAPSHEPAAAPTAPKSDEALVQLKAQVEEMQRQIQKLASKS